VRTTRSQLPEPLETSLRGLPAIRCYSPRPTSQLREHRKRSRLHRGDYRGPGRSRQGFSDEQVHPYA
jgi:hypothetical protein